jgi:prepilin-type N-terminal cleavage/methylation domain-containing protein
VIKNQTINHEAGFTLIEALVTISVLGILITTSILFLSDAQTSLKVHEQPITRTRMIQSLINIMGMPASVRASAIQAGTTSRLYLCAREGGCNSADPTTDLSLYLPVMTEYPLGSISTSGRISGPPSDPVLYNLDGVACDPAAKTCLPTEYPIAVSTQFDAICPPQFDVISGIRPVPLGSDVPLRPLLDPMPSCFKANYIKIHYNFSLAAGAPATYSFPPVTGTLMVSATKVFHSE